jgi:hypothetical protein
MAWTCYRVSAITFKLCAFSNFLRHFAAGIAKVNMPAAARNDFCGIWNGAE